MAGLTVLAAGPRTAEAKIVQAHGAYGYSVPGNVVCDYHNYTGKLTILANPPFVYAYNRYSGAGNDWQQVRYRIVWYSAQSWQPILYSNWSSFLWAGDNANQLAKWSGTTPWNASSYSGYYAVGTQIVFYGRNGLYEGSVTHIQDKPGSYINFQEGKRAGVSDQRCISTFGVIG